MKSAFPHAPPEPANEIERDDVAKTTELKYITFNSNTPDMFLPMSEVVKTTSLSRSSIYAYIKRNDFPKPYLLGVRARRFLASEIAAWIDNRVTSQRNVKG